MRRILSLCVLAALLMSVCLAQADETEPPAEIEDGESNVQTHIVHEVDDNGEPIMNPNYEEDVKRLIKLCKLIKEEMHEIFLLKDHHKQEGAILGLAGVLGHHLDETHEAWDVEHKTWTCAKAREAMKNEHTKEFIDHFERWYNGNDISPPITHERTVYIVQHLHDELLALRLMNQDTSDELQEIIDDLKHLEKWHLDLRDSYNQMMHEDNSHNCEVPFQKFIATLSAMHGEHVPEWYHVAEGVNLLLEQCKEDPAISGEL